MRQLPDPNAIFPNPQLPTMCYIKNVINAPNISVGDYTYYDDPDDATKFEEKCVLFNWQEFRDKLIIGKFCAIAYGTRFLMGSANHRMTSASTYPFNVLGGEWERTTPPHLSQLPRKGDTIIGNDVWLGCDCLIMPGVNIGDGAVIAARSVVVNDIEPYTIAGGNPAKPIKKRLDDSLIKLLQELKWWDLPADELADIIPLLCENDFSKLINAAEKIIGKR